MFEWVGVPFAILIFAIAGIRMIAGSSKESEITAAKSMITNALIGLGIMLTAWVIVNTAMLLLTGGQTSFNNALFSGPWNQLPSVDNCPLQGPVGTGGGGGIITGGGPGPAPTPTPTPLPPTGTLSNQDAVSQLNSAGIQVSSTGGCSDRLNPNCTSLDGIPSSAVNSLIALETDLKKNCSNCFLTVTGGTEVGHSTHGPGKSIVDLSSGNVQVNQFIKNQIGTQTPQINTWYSGGSSRYYFYEGNHWHVCLNSADCPQAVGTD